MNVGTYNKSLLSPPTPYHRIFTAFDVAGVGKAVVVMSFQDVQLTNKSRPDESTSHQLRMRRNHPPKLPRVKAVPFTPPAVSLTKPSVKKPRGMSVEQSSGGNNTGSRRSDSSTVKGFRDDLIDSYELNASNSNSSNTETSQTFLLDHCIEARDDYESFGPDRSQRQHSGATQLSSSLSARNQQRKQKDNNVASKSHSRNVKPSAPVSTFAKLTYEMQQYQKLVSDLEYMVSETIVAPEVAWRTNILVKSVKETDYGINQELEQYEKSLAQQERLLTYNNDKGTHQNDKRRITQQLAACTKLRRDFNRCHKSMTISLQTHALRQNAEISQLGAVQWNAVNRNGSQGAVPPTDEDFFERTMRQKELERMNDSMRKVNDIYNSLAGLVNGQQDHIDKLEDDANYSNANVKSGYDEFTCYMDRQNGLNTFCGEMNEWGQTEDSSKGTSMRDPTTNEFGPKLRINENFYWSMPFETMKEDWQSVQHDFMGIGRGFVIHCQRLDCCNDD